VYAQINSQDYVQWVCSPASTELEAIIMDWAAKLFGLDDKFLTSSGVGGGVLQVSSHSLPLPSYLFDVC
jgi:aromatic-L-amino-acid/L-tryptophan decarboxylase